MTLTEFLLARIADDEEAARQALALRGSGTDWPLGHPCDPARALVECEAQRRIVEHCDATPACGGYIPPGRERDEHDAHLGFIPARHLPRGVRPRLRRMFGRRKREHERLVDSQAPRQHLRRPPGLPRGVDVKAPLTFIAIVLGLLWLCALASMAQGNPTAINAVLGIPVGMVFGGSLIWLVTRVD